MPTEIEEEVEELFHQIVKVIGDKLIGKVSHEAFKIGLKSVSAAAAFLIEATIQDEYFDMRLEAIELFCRETKEIIVTRKELGLKLESIN